MTGIRSNFAKAMSRYDTHAAVVRFAKRAAVAVTICAMATPAVAVQGKHWGSFKYNGCKVIGGAHFKVYSSVLWGIPNGQSWEVACSNMPATVDNTAFPHPTLCQKASAADAMGVTGAVLSTIGWVNPMAKAAGAVVGASAIVMKQEGWGALNMWGVFYKKVDRC
jgi:hypothetical protein